MKSHHNHNSPPNININSNYNYNNKNMARSHSSKCNNMPDLIDLYIQKKVDPNCTSAESSTCSQIMPTNYFAWSKNKITNYIHLENPQPCNNNNNIDNNHSRNIGVKKKSANIHYSDLHNINNCDNRRASSDYDGMNMGEVVCSMCGDVGIAELLFLCSRCSHRPQHIYCSRSYPDLCGEASICNWCLHEEDSLISSAAKPSTVLNDTVDACTKASEDNKANACPNVNVARPIKELNYTEAHVNEAEYKDEVLVNKGHGKAFEYLLLIAAQSLPQVISESNDEIKRANDNASMINITNPKMGSLDNKDLDRKVNMGYVDKKGDMDNQANINNEKRLIVGLDSKQRMELHSNLRIKVDDKMDHVGVYGGNIPKRQRCSKGINASLKCRKRGLQLSPSRPNYRRYKLLADVVC